MVNHPEPAGIDKQLAKLFGESLFGGWLDPHHTVAPSRGLAKRRAWGRQLAALLLLTSLVLAATIFIRRGLARQAGARRAQLCEELCSFLREGELERSAAVLSLIRAERTGSETSQKDRDLLARTEAALYRYHDADPARLKAVQRWSGAPTGGAPDQILAGLTVQSREERAANLSVLRDLRAHFSEDAEYHYLLASALEQHREVEPAREAWQRSAELGPLWFVHRFEQAAFERRQGHAEAAAKVASAALRAAPGSAWANLFRSSFPVQSAPPSLLGPAQQEVVAPAPAPASPPVEVHRARLVEAVEAARRSDLMTARRLLHEALTAVRGEAPFVLDAYDWILDEGQVALGRELTAFDAWPAGSPLARAKLDRLAQPVPTVDSALDALPVDSRAKSDHGPKPGSSRHKNRAKGVKLTRSARP